MEKRAQGMSLQQRKDDLPEILRRFEQENMQKVAAEKYRCHFHLMAPVGWLNDPNGLSYFGDRYHVFFQYSPFAVNGGMKLWGHYTSKDLVQYKYEGAPFLPDETYDKDGVFSGSAIVWKDKMYLFYTGNVEEEGDHDYIHSGRGANVIRVISEDGEHFSAKQCILTNADYPAECTNQVRDPKLFQMTDGTFRMVLGAWLQDDKGAVLLYSSTDLEHFTFEQLYTTEKAFGYMWECPDFYPVGDKYVLMFSPMGGKERTSVYLVGDFDYDTGKFFYTISGEIDWGFDYYAPQSFQAPDGRRILVGWANAWDWMPFWKDWGPTYQEGWCGFFNIPREAVLAEDNTLKFIPVKELQDLRKNKQEEADILIKEDEKKELRSGCVYETEMRINLKKSTADKIRLNLRMSQGKKTEILFDLKRAEAYFDRNNSDGWSKGVARCPLNLMGKEHLDIHIYSDKISLEIFSNDYQNNFSCNIYNVDDDQKNEVKAIGGDLMIESIRSWELEKTMK